MCREAWATFATGVRESYVPLGAGEGAAQARVVQAPGAHMRLEQVCEKQNRKRKERTMGGNPRRQWRMHTAAPAGQLGAAAGARRCPGGARRC